MEKTGFFLSEEKVTSLSNAQAEEVRLLQRQCMQMRSGRRGAWEGSGAMGTSLPVTPHGAGTAVPAASRAPHCLPPGPPTTPSRLLLFPVHVSQATRFNMHKVVLGRQSSMTLERLFGENEMAQDYVNELRLMM